MTRNVLSIAFFGLLTACGGAHQGTYEVGSAAEGSDASAAMAKADTHWQARGDAAELQAALSAYEEAVTADPTNRVALERLVRGYYFLGDGHNTEDADKLASWDTAINWGKQCMGLNADFVARLDKGETEAAAGAASFTKDDVPCVYWTASALGKWAKLTSFGTLLKNKDLVKAWITKVDELDDTYFYTASTRYWGAYYAIAPSFAGGDLGKSKEYFDEAIAANPGHFGNRILLAEAWATKQQNETPVEALNVFDEQLTYVLSNCANNLEGLQPEQEAEQRKANALLGKRTELFLEAGEMAAIDTPDCSAPVEEPAVEEAEETEGSDEAAEETETEGTTPTMGPPPAPPAAE